MGEHTLMTEHFVPIEDFEHYEVSNYGRVVNKKSGYDIHPTYNSSGFLRVALYKEGKKKERLLHRLVAGAFFADFTPKMHVEFINGLREDCAVANLTLRANSNNKRIQIVETGVIYPSVKAAADAIGGIADQISRAAHGNADTKRHRGYSFRYID